MQTNAMSMGSSDGFGNLESIKIDEKQSLRDRKSSYQPVPSIQSTRRYLNLKHNPNDLMAKNRQLFHKARKNQPQSAYTSNAPNKHRKSLIHKRGESANQSLHPQMIYPNLPKDPMRGPAMIRVSMNAESSQSHPMLTEHISYTREEDTREYDEPHNFEHKLIIDLNNPNAKRQPF